jgi:hypothetical protein
MGYKDPPVFLVVFEIRRFDRRATHGGFQMINPKVLEERKRAIEERLGGRKYNFAGTPEFSAGKIKYEMAERTQAMNDGGGLLPAL